MQVFSLDLGNKQTKVRSSMGEYVLPSNFLYKADMPISFGTNNSNKDTHTFSVPFSEDEYVWGKDISQLHLDEYMVDTIMYGNRYEDDSFKLLTNFSIGLLARDFVEAKKGVLEVAITIGLPTGDYADQTKLNAITEVLDGQHQITIDGQILTVRVKQIYILPQPIGTLYNELLDDKGFIENKDLLDKMIGVVDIGGGTILIDTILNFELSGRNRQQFNTGANSLYEVIDKQIDGHVSLHQLADELRKGMKDKKFSYTFSANRKDDITDIVNKEIDRFTRQLIANVKTTLKNIENIDLLLVTGGGANLVNRKLVKAAFAETEIKFVSETETANVDGFYKFGLDQESKRNK
ncbi:ParM/StbA family protein [Lactobacillus sp. ESL0681]|uniref:ParM/StbA family protein n=1 Tax=Lactobacillus sp. ESL0681 TaxID=2983211 RepID=UPI0023F90F95|nr:ParM/StbA family protein [Lactobacillus sp. ESL0681]WEV41292.1 ParM/StbA family protein [Lactobacillus sp. ESL0681]